MFENSRKQKKQRNQQALAHFAQKTFKLIFPQWLAKSSGSQDPASLDNDHRGGAGADPPGAILPLQTEPQGAAAVLPDLVHRIPQDLYTEKPVPQNTPGAV
ncbi:hypothetical protein DPMN_161967 [Dreissena polymorpha]|uniref:Uncharacterized protein n=1 Tax=Dreissena polymorpha TaxID=45954 RepID=A0A9D4EPG6_DREPO|nr:hypothetical protein DPMN_161967 [Dreissena polymorpha]